MSVEIELKVHVEDSETLKLRLSGKAEYLGSFEKNDTYWFPAEVSPAATQVSAAALPSISCFASYGLRVRGEERKLPNGSGESTTLITYKIKELRDGIEVNEEREFEVKPRFMFEEFLKASGFKPGAAKQKRGWAFSRGRINAELTNVEGLGWFAELEILAGNSDKETVRKARQELLDLLDSLGIGKDAIESRSYLQMLQESQAKS